MASSTGISIPCYWPHCQQMTHDMRRLAEHIQKQHKVTEGFGCRHCGFKHSSREVTQSHISVEHQEQENPPAAASALAHYYRRRYKERNAHLLNIPDAAFWQRGAKGGKRACSEEGRCPECDVNITPYNKTNIIRHLRQNHCIVIDIDSTRLLQRHSNREIADIPADVYPTSVHAEDVDLSDIDEHEDAGIIDDGHFDNEVMDWDQIQVDQPLGTNKESGESAPLNGTATLDTPAPCPILSPKAQSTYTRDTFLSCLKEGSILNIKNALGMNETRTFNGRQYRVRRDAPINSILDSKEIVCALLTNSGWHCQVPQCGASIDEIFAIDLHLDAHGGINLTEWYCGDLSCEDGSEKVFNNREDFNFHITTDHQGSSYSFTALRRVPKTEVLVARLAKQLRLEHTTTQPSASEDEHIEATAIARKETSTTIRQDTMDKDASDESDDEDALVKQEDHAWAQLRRFFNAGVASRSEAESGSEDDNALSEDREFRRHCNDRYVCLSDKPKQGLVPVIHPPNYLVETLTSIQCMTKEDAKDYLITYCKFCRLLGTNDPNAVRRALGLPSHERREAEDACQRQDSPSQGRGRSGVIQGHGHSHVSQPTTRYHISCPWPGCEYVVHIRSFTTRSRDHGSARYSISVHVLAHHLSCVWQCPEEDCAYCVYRLPWRLERHRLNCHVGSPLQCGHQNCNKVLVDQPLLSRGHTVYWTLQSHHEFHFNQHLRSLQKQVSTAKAETSTEDQNAQRHLPSTTKYLEQFRGKSSLYLTGPRQSYRRSCNHQILAQHHIEPEDISIQGSMACTGFWYWNRHYPCADSVSLHLGTTMLIFVPSLLLFTVAPTCDFCVHAMSLISRYIASLPLPLHFGLKLAEGRQRIGIGSSISDHSSFLRVVQAQRLLIPPMAERYRWMREFCPEKIFIVDFESVRRSERGLPLRLVEITVRNGNNDVIVSCIINNSGTTNEAYEEELKTSGYTDPLSFHSARRIRGSPAERFPSNAKTPKEIIDILRRAGLSPHCLWVEYSMMLFDRKCMETLIKEAGLSADGILPPHERCWTVVQDFARSLPGLASYQLGRVLKLINPGNPHLHNLHRSESDTAVLHDLLERWLFLYGRLRETRC
ncbi:hypothetical protein EDD36DRAFT_101425 [Exophiala viscosa]|uniref:C2H2-type domain-containing protein n=1 Tax=Exophiala viscosa TaxID=2486360 RepID=A0AAN6DNR0_9EURO|nr:hypothetical protein EDD36DRAFT_101425 [Exophiala viscosa]